MNVARGLQALFACFLLAKRHAEFRGFRSERSVRRSNISTISPARFSTCSAALLIWMVNVQVLVLPDASTAMVVTAVTPIANSEPGAGVDVPLAMALQASLTLGAE